MKALRVRLILAAALCGLRILSAPAVSLHAQEGAQPDFPLSPGAYWVYAGTVRWTAGTEIKEATLTWKMEVLDVVSRGAVTGYAIHGYPSDLVGYEEGKQPGDATIIQVGSRFYLAGPDAFQRLRDQNDSLAGLVNDGQEFLDLPLRPGERFGDSAQITREDGMYCWVIESAAPADLSGVSGAALAQPADEYTLSYRTLPDQESIGFVPGIGITRFFYLHHGTVSEVDVKLVEYHPATG